jgi:shikimate dehydrogenase
MDHYAVFGNPIYHSKSPIIHQLFAAETGQNLIYTKVLVPLDSFANYIDYFQNQGGKGLNITQPFKQQAYSLLESLSERAKLAQAVNTICFQPNGIRYGDNTDGVGFIRDLKQNLQRDIVSKRILILGAGGAVRGILGPLLAEKPQHITIANRTLNKAFDLVKQFNEPGCLTTCTLAELKEPYDVIINSTSAEFQGEMPALSASIINAHTFCYDLGYSSSPLTPFLSWAQAQGAISMADGLGMLVEQAAEAFYLWRGVKPETRDVIKQLRSQR